ncbi:MAG: hypothetical protein ACYC3S_06515 [Chloroflexota bacterium]
MPDKWEREIEDLLRDKFRDDEPTPLRPVRRPPRKAQPPRGPSEWRRRLAGVSSERLILLGVVFALAAYLFRPFFGTVTLLLVLTSVACILGAVVFSVLRHENPSVEKRWRGQPVNLAPRRRPTSFTWYRLRATLRRWLNRWR